MRELVRPGAASPLYATRAGVHSKIVPEAVMYSVEAAASRQLTPLLTNG